MRDSDKNRYWLAAEVLLGVTVVALPAALGGAPPWTLWLLMGLSASVLATWSLGARRNARRWSWHPVLLLALFPVGVEALQLIPLPPFLLGLVAPASAELRNFALVPLGLEGWRPVSLDAPSTWRLLARDASLGSLLFVALQLGRLPAPRRRLLSAVGATAIAFTLIAFVHQLGGLDELFGFWSFRTATPLLTPFGNANHLAGFLTLGGTVCLGLAISSSARESLIGWGVGALACGVTIFLSMSRGGVVAFLATWLMVGALVLARRTGGLRSATPWILIGATMVGAGLLALDQLVARADTLSSVAKLQSSKMEAWPMFAQAVRAAWPTGLGRGAFEVGFSRWHDYQLSVTFTHPENLALQWASEVGVPGALALLGLTVYALWRCFRSSAGHPAEQVALVALVGLGLHDLFDFSLELNAVPTVAVVVLGLVAGLDEAQPRRMLRRRDLAALAAGMVLAGFAGWKGFPTHHDAEDTLAEWIRANRSAPELRRDAAILLDRHPADYLLYANLAQATAATGDARIALAWVNRWLFLRPADPRAHVAAAQALLRLGRREQALLEFQTAFSLGDFADLRAALAVAAKQGDFERILIDRRGLLPEAFAVSAHLSPKNEIGRALLARALAQPPNEEVRLEAQELALSQEAIAGDPAKAMTMLEALPEAARVRSDLVALKGRLLVSTGRVDEGVKLLEALLVQEPDNVAVALQVSEALAGIGRRDRAREVLVRLRPFLSSAAARSNVFCREAGLWEQDLRWSRALDAWQTASRIEPERADLHYRIANAYERMGSAHSALDEVRRGRLLDTLEGSKAQDPWVARLESAESSQLRAPGPSGPP